MKSSTINNVTEITDISKALYYISPDKTFESSDKSIEISNKPIFENIDKTKKK